MAAQSRGNPPEITLLLKEVDALIRQEAGKGGTAIVFSWLGDGTPLKRHEQEALLEAMLAHGYRATSVYNNDNARVSINIDWRSTL